MSEKKLTAEQKDFWDRWHEINDMSDEEFEVFVRELGRGGRDR